MAQRGPIGNGFRRRSAMRQQQGGSEICVNGGSDDAIDFVDRRLGTWSTPLAARQEAATRGAI